MLRDYIQLGIAVFLTVVGSGLLIAGFAINPTGEIHDSVLISFGEIMTFVAGLLGIDYFYGQRYQRFKAQYEEERKQEKK